MSPITIQIQDLIVRFLLATDKTYSLKEIAANFVRGVKFKKQVHYHEALSKVNLTIYEGDIIGIIGPNGCGKTTLLKAISGIYHPDEGSVQCFGQVSSLLSLGTGFNNELNGIDNIRLNGLTLGMPLRQIEEKIPQIIQFADIGEYIYMPMKYYSSGMISRLSFSIILSMQPDILLIDEIFSVGDLAFQKKSEKALHNILSRTRCQLIVTHSLSLVREHCNRAIFMQSGAVVMDGNPNDVVDEYERIYT